MRLPNIFRRQSVEPGHEGHPAPKVALAKSFVAQVWDSPATHNRATRRAARLWGRIWKWDVNTPGMQRTYVPRYIRRHYSNSVPRTRRQRKVMARIFRISRTKGIGL